MIEKPFGRDLETAKELNAIVDAVFPAESVFRIDHYLGKETVQNILALRFANTLYEPIWNRSYVDHVQITMSEDIGIGGRAGYYDGIGAARDVIQNHLLQLLALTAMEEPVSFDADSLRQEKEKVLSAVRLPADLAEGTARGQYAAGWQGGRQVTGFLEEEGIPADSRTETYAAVRLSVDTRRWAGVPFYLRTGKRLTRRMTEIALLFQRAPHLPFAATDTKELGQNALVIRVQPDEGVTVRFGSKVPGSAMEVRDVNMDFAYGESFTESSPEAYERLILDVLIGDPPLFPARRRSSSPGASSTRSSSSGPRTPSRTSTVRLGRARVRGRDDGARRPRLATVVGEDHSNDDRPDRHHHRRHRPGADRGAAAARRHDARHGAHAHHRDRRGGAVRRHPGRQPGGPGAPVPHPRRHHPQAEGRLAARRGDPGRRGLAGRDDRAAHVRPARRSTPTRSSRRCSCPTSRW